MVTVHEQQRHGFADDVAAAKDDGLGAFDLDIVAAKNLHAACGSAGDKSRASTDQPAEIDRMKAVHVFRGIDGLEDALGIDVYRERKLNEDPVDSVVSVEIADEAKHLVGGDRGGRCVHPAR
jgi:hypothetical protein